MAAGGCLFELSHGIITSAMQQHAVPPPPERARLHEAPRHRTTTLSGKPKVHRDDNLTLLRIARSAATTAFVNMSRARYVFDSGAAGIRRDGRPQRRMAAAKLTMPLIFLRVCSMRCAGGDRIWERWLFVNTLSARHDS